MKSKDENYSFLDISEVFCYKIKQKYNFINKNCEDSLKIMDNYLFLNKENKYFFSKIPLVQFFGQIQDGIVQLLQFRQCEFGRQ